MQKEFKGLLAIPLVWMGVNLAGELINTLRSFVLMGPEHVLGMSFIRIDRVIFEQFPLGCVIALFVFMPIYKTMQRKGKIDIKHFMLVGIILSLVPLIWATMHFGFTDLTRGSSPNFSPGFSFVGSYLKGTIFSLEHLTYIAAGILSSLSFWFIVVRKK